MKKSVIILHSNISVTITSFEYISVTILLSISVLPKKSGWILLILPKMDLTQEVRLDFINQSYPRRHVGFGLTQEVRLDFINQSYPRRHVGFSLTQEGMLDSVLPKLDLYQEGMLDSVLPKTGSLPRIWFLYKNELR